jgi:hypothetical protein
MALLVQQKLGIIAQKPEIFQIGLALLEYLNVLADLLVFVVEVFLNPDVREVPLNVCLLKHLQDQLSV